MLGSRRSFTARWLALAVLVLTAACAPSPGSSTAGDGPPESRFGSNAEVEIEPLSSAQWRRMRAAGMVRPECPIQRRGQLRSLRVNYVGFDGGTRRGQLVVNADVAESVARIFVKLFDEGFPIRRMRSVEAYDGDTSRSLRADNTSGFNCRRPDQINAPFRDSPHANGRAVDINPRENPWKDLRCRCWFPTGSTKERVEGPGIIVRGGLAWKLFRDEGWTWQDIDVPDYMHFDTGYPSRPYSGSARK